MISNKVIFDTILILLVAKIINKNETDKKKQKKIIRTKLYFSAFSLVFRSICITFANWNENERMTQEEKTLLEERIVDVLKTVYDPEIPVNIYDLGMIYKIDVQEDCTVELEMTFTAPNCPAADYILEDVRTKVESVEGIKGANVNLVFEPAWDQSMMSEEARVELGFD